MTTTAPTSGEAERVKQAMADMWRAIQHQHPELAGLSLVNARTATVPCAETDTALDGPVVRSAVERAMTIEDLDGATEAHLVAEVILIALLHLAAHALASQRGLTETSNRGYYHNRAFKQVAEEVGLDVWSDTERSGRGWGNAGLGERTEERYDEQVEFLAAVIATEAWPVQTPAETGPAGGASGSRNYVPATCGGCTPARRIRASRAEFDRGAVLCGVCGTAFAPLTSTS